MSIFFENKLLHLRTGKPIFYHTQDKMMLLLASFYFQINK